MASAALPLSASVSPSTTIWAGSDAHAPVHAHNPRKRGRTACTRCKNRKQKCDDQWPVCSNCRKAGTDCDKTAVTEDEPPAAYTRALEERVAFLEAQVTDLGAVSNTTQLLPEDGAYPSPPLHSPRPPARTRDALGDVVELLAMGNFEAPAYIGSSSGLNLALNLGEMVQATVWNKAIPSRGESPPAKRRKPSVANSLSSHDGRPSRAVTMEEVYANSASPPSDDRGRAYLAAYFRQIHTRYPFLDPDDVWALHCDRTALAATPAALLTKPQRFGIFKLYMAYAIGAMLLQPAEKHAGSPPEGYYMAALQHISAARESRTTQNIEAMTLLVVYHLRSPSSGGLWYMIGLAMRTCIDLGLHRRPKHGDDDALVAQKQRRLFWSVYALERTIAISLGRPPSLPDRHIDVALPDEDMATTTTSPPQLDAPLSPFGYRDAPADWKTPLTTAVCLFRLRRIESRIQNAIYRADKPLSALAGKLDRYHGELAAWKAALPLTGRARDDALLHYHGAERLLLQPFLGVLAPGDPYYKQCLRAAGAVCQAHKRRHQRTGGGGSGAGTAAAAATMDDDDEDRDAGDDYGRPSFIAVQSVFVAGVTLLYALWTRAHAVWSVALADDVRAASLALFVMGERAPWVRRYRDAFELLVRAAMDKLQQHAGDDEEGRAQPQEPPQPQQQQQQNEDPDGLGGAAAAADEDDDCSARRVVAELASWIDQDQDDDPAWMVPDFEALQGLT